MNLDKVYVSIRWVRAHFHYSYYLNFKQVPLNLKVSRTQYGNH